eukprot:g27530.t1
MYIFYPFDFLHTNIGASPGRDSKSLSVLKRGLVESILSTYEENANLILPSDMSAAGFYITNTYNTL